MQGNMLQVFKWGMNFNWKMTDNDIFSVLCVPECVICTHMLYVDFEVAETNCETSLPIGLTLYLCNADFLFLVHIAHTFYHCRYFWHLKAYETKWVLYCNFDISILCVCICVCMYCSTNIPFLCLFCNAKGWITKWFPVRCFLWWLTLRQKLFKVHSSVLTEWPVERPGNIMTLWGLVMPTHHLWHYQHRQDVVHILY